MEERRSGDARIERLEQRMERFEGKLDENTATTREVRDILATFKIVGAVAKWCSIVGGAFVAMYHGVDWLKHR